MQPPASLLGRARGYGLVAAAAPEPAPDAPPNLDARIFAIAAPSLVALALDPVLNVVDTAFVGRAAGASATPLAAVSGATGFFALVFACTNLGLLFKMQFFFCAAWSVHLPEHLGEILANFESGLPSGRLPRSPGPW